MKFGPKIVTDGLVLALDAANPNSYLGSGTAWNDLTPNKNNGTLVNGPTFSEDGGGSINFDGVNDYAIINNNVATNLTQLTMECWARVNSLSGFTGIFTLFDGIPYKGYGFNSANNDRIQFLVAKNNDGSFTYLNSDSNFNSGAWYHLVGIVDLTEAYFYINSIRQASYVSYTTPTVPGNIPITLGRFYYDTPGFNGFNGSISNARIYNRILSPSEVLQNYNALKDRFI